MKYHFNRSMQCLNFLSFSRLRRENPEIIILDSPRVLRVLKRYAFTVLFVLLFSANAYGAQLVDRIAAIVNNDVVTEYEVQQLKKELPGKTDSQVLDSLISERILDQKVKEAKIDVTEDDLARAIKRILIQNQISLAQLRGEVTKQGMTYEQYVSQLKQQLARQKFVNQTVGTQVKITDRDIRDYYEKHKDRFKGSYDDERDAVYDAIYEAKLPQALNAYIARQKSQSFVEIKS